MKKSRVVMISVFALSISLILLPLTAPYSASTDGFAEKAAKNLSRAVQFKTISNQDTEKVDGTAFDAFNEFLMQTYPKIHTELEREFVNNYSLIYKWKGSDPDAKALVFLAHSDVVPIAPGTVDDWTHPPFEGRIADGYIWGRGTMDDKGSLMSIMEAVEGLLAEGFKPRRTIYLCFGQDEEVGGAKGAVAIAAKLASRGVKAEYVIDEGGAIVSDVMPGFDKSVAMVGIAEKGYLTLELIVRDGGGHSSMPPEHSAIGILATAIHRLERNPFPARLEGPALMAIKAIGPEMPFVLRFAISNDWLFGGIIKKKLAENKATNATMRTTIATTIIEAGTKENVLPQEAKAIVNFRLLPGDSIDYVVKRVTKTINDPRVEVKITGKANEASGVTDVKGDAFKKVEAAINATFPGIIVAPFLVMGGTDCRHYSEVSENLLRFIPMRAGPEDLERVHGTDERIGVENYAEIVKFYEKLMKDSN